MIKKDAELCTIGFALANASSKEELTTFSVTIDELESQTGLDFFLTISKNEQAQIESKMKYDIWFTVSQ